MCKRITHVYSCGHTAPDYIFCAAGRNGTCRTENLIASRHNYVCAGCAARARASKAIAGGSEFPYKELGGVCDYGTNVSKRSVEVEGFSGEHDSALISTHMVLGEMEL